MPGPPMLPKPICLAAVLVGIFFACQKEHAPSGPVGDIVVRNAHVYTVDAQRPWAQAVAIKDDRIVWVGDEKDAETHAGPTTKVIDAGGRMLLRSEEHTSELQSLAYLVCRLL